MKYTKKPCHAQIRDDRICCTKKTLWVVVFSSDAEIHSKKLKVSLLFYGILAIFDGRYIISQKAKVTQINNSMAKNALCSMYSMYLCSYVR